LPLTGCRDLKGIAILDRIDLHVEVDPVKAADLALPPPSEGSAGDTA
jgi:magnesium chelatase family protein